MKKPILFNGLSKTVLALLAASVTYNADAVAEPRTPNVGNFAINADRTKLVGDDDANMAAAQADKERLEALQAELTAIVKDNEKYLTPDDNDIINDILGETWPMTIQGTLEGVEEEGEYESPINWAQLTANVYEVRDNIAKREANANAWNAIQQQIAEVQTAIDYFDNIVATLPYASRFEGEEITGPVDVARDWVTMQTDTYTAKFEAGELTAEDGLMGEMKEQTENVYAALNSAAQYDIYRHVQAATLAWAGEEDVDEIKGAREDVLAIIETLPEAGQSALNERIVLLEAAIDELMESYHTYTAYNEDNHADLVAACEAITNNVADIVAAANQAVNDNVWEAVQQQIAQVQAAIDNFDAIVETLEYAKRYEGEEVIGAVDAARAWVATTTEEYTAKHEAGELTYEDGLMGAMMEQTAAVNEALNIAAMYDASRYTSAVMFHWYGNEDDEIEGVRDGVVASIETLSEAGQSALLEQVELLEVAIKEMIDEYNVYTLYNEDNHAYFVETYGTLMANINEVVAAAAKAVNDNVWEAAQLQIAEVEAAIADFEAVVETLEYAKRYEGEEITGPVDAARAWVATITEDYTAKHEADELTAEDGLMGAMMDHKAAIYEAINNAARYDVSRYTGAVVNYWAGDEDEIEGVRDGILEAQASLPEAGQSAIEEQVVQIETAIAEMLQAYEEYTSYNDEAHAKFPEMYDVIISNINELLSSVAGAVNDNVWENIQTQIAQVAQAIETYEEIVATLPYASRYEGEELTENVDAAREWIAATTEAYEAKHEAGELTNEDGVMAEMLEQIAAVNEALNLAANYDASRNTFAVINYWYGNEDEEIEGVKDGVTAVIESLPEAGQDALQEQVDMLEAAIAEMWQDCQLYVAYNEDTQNEFAAKSEALIASINDILAAADKAVIDNAWANIQTQIAQVAQAIETYEAIVATLPYASRYEGEELTENVDKAREWIAATTEAYEAKYEAGELTYEDGVMGEMLEQIAAVNEALNLAANYDAGRHTFAVVNYWFGNEDEDIRGVREDVVATMSTLSEAGYDALNEQVVLLETAIGELIDEYNLYTAYNEEAQAHFVEQHEALMASIQDILDAAEEAAAAHAADLAAEEARKEANLAASQLDMMLVEELQAELTAVIAGNDEYISEEDNDAIEVFLGEKYLMMVSDAYEAVLEAGDYESPIDEAELRAFIADIAKNIEANKELAVAIERIKAQISADGIYTLDGRRVESPVKGQVNIFRKDGKFVKMYVK